MNEALAQSGMTAGEIAKAIDSMIDSIVHKFTGLSAPDARYKRTLEKRLAKRLDRTFKKQMDYVIRHSADLSAFNQKSSVIRIETKTLQKEIDDMLDDMPGNPTIVDDIIAVSGTSMNRGGKERIRKMGLSKYGISFNLKNERAVSYLSALETFELSEARGTIDYVTKKRIKDVLVESAEKGLSYQDTSKKIQELGKHGVFSQARGELIATRETGVAYEKGNRFVMEDFVAETGATVMKKWQTVNDDRVTPSHTANQQEGLIPMGATFSGTGDQEAPASDNPRCRCFTDYQVI